MRQASSKFSEFADTARPVVVDAQGKIAAGVSKISESAAPVISQLSERIELARPVVEARLHTAKESAAVALDYASQGASTLATRVSTSAAQLQLPFVPPSATSAWASSAAATTSTTSERPPAL